jgi:hypothetical protein
LIFPANIQHISPSDLESIAKNGKLIELEAKYNCGAVSDSSIRAFADYCPKLKKLNLTHFLHIVSNDTIKYTISKCLFLESLTPPPNFDVNIMQDAVKKNFKLKIM